MVDTCICCGTTVPEGRMVCPLCIHAAGESKHDFFGTSGKDVIKPDGEYRRFSLFQLFRSKKAATDEALEEADHRFNSHGPNFVGTRG